MEFMLTNITDSRTVYVNVKFVKFIEEDAKSGNAIITMNDNAVFHTNENCAELLENWGIVKVEDEDATLEKNECMIETGNGVFDCSLGTQLEALNEELRLLSYEA